MERAQPDLTDRPTPWGPIAAGVVIVAAPVVAIVVDDHAINALRSFVLAQGLVLFCMWAYTLYGVVGRVLTKRQPQLAREIQLGHACHLFAELIALILFMDFSVHRLGKATLDWHTPLLQGYLWMLLLAWQLMERKAWRPMS